MNRQQRVAHVMAIVAIAVPACFALPAAAAPPAGTAVDQGTRQAVVELLDRMPLLFVQEQVAPDGATAYAVRGSEASVWLSDRGLSYRLHPAGVVGPNAGAGSWVVALDLVGATPRTPLGEGPLPTRVSYFKGPRDQWRAGLPSYGSVVYREPWPGVDLVVSGTAGELKSSFVVRPGADPRLIRLAYRGADAVRLEPDGSLVVDTPLGSITEEAPVAYQEADGHRVGVAAAFELVEGSQPGRQVYRFRLGEYDTARELVVDPVTLVYCGYIGGSGSETGSAITVDPEGNAYVTGNTSSTEATFPVTVGPDLTYSGGNVDAFVAKVNAAGTALDYCGYIGGSGSEVGEGIAVDTAGNAYVTGRTNSSQLTFPVVVGPDLTINGGNYDAFVAKVNAAGTALDYCGYVGGSGDDLGRGIAVDAAGNAYVTGDTTSTEATFPVAVGPDLTHNEATDGFVARVNAAGTFLDYCGYIGGSNSDWSWRIAVDAAGNAYVMGFTRSDEATFPVNVGPDLSYNGGLSYGDAFVARVATAGTALDYCGYIGGSGDDFGWGIAVDADGNAYVTGQTDSSQLTFPVVVGPDLTYNGGFDDAFVAKVNAAGTALDYCGYIGGSGHDVGLGIAVDAAGRAYVTGQTDSSEATFPVVVGPDLTYNDDGEYGDAFVAKVNAAGTMLASCGYIGGWGVESGSSIAVDGACTAYVAGYIAADDAGFPVTIGPDLTYNGANDAFVTKLHSSEFSLGATPSSFEICAGTDAEYTVTVGAICGFGNDVTLAASGNPAGSTTSFSVDPVPPPGSSVLTIGNTGGAAGGSYVVTIGGTADGSADLSVDVTLDVVVAPAPPSLTAPPNGATGQPLRPTFQWAAAAGADSYCLEVDDDLVFGSPAISMTGILGTTFTPSSDLEENMIYYWRVRSENPCGCGAASTVFSFTTAGVSLPGEFAKIAPANGATGQATDLTLSWSTSTNAISYERCVDTTDNDACDTSWINVGDVTSTMLGGLVESTAYFWQVRAINGQGSTEADGGDWWWFITTPYLFSDGFESGDTSAWSVTMP